MNEVHCPRLLLLVGVISLDFCQVYLILVFVTNSMFNRVGGARGDEMHFIARGCILGDG